MIRFMRYLFAASVLIELIIIVLYIVDFYNTPKGVFLTLLSMIVLQASLIYNSKFKLFKK